ncbi:hypothetical protein [Streptomyces omiyaensis]|uniref:Uncharacterized protein n=1 Tax=Streptomyces omiyaensis TaxID=68247 RepID=A0ABW7BUD0_9ACTN|nr:hypothetical protein [Streptomyces omiyaensis]
MTPDMEHPLHAHLRERFGHEDGWTEATSLIAPYLRIVVDALEPEDAVTFLTAVREALNEEAARAGTIHLGFGAHLWSRLDAGFWDASPAKASAWEAALAMHRLATLVPSPGLPDLVDTGLRCCRSVRIPVGR